MAFAVIFDFDGVIADTEMLHFKAFNVILDKYDAVLSKEIYWLDYLGYTDKECFEAVSDNFKLSFTSEQIDKLIDDKEIVFDKMVKQESAIISGVFEFLTLLKENSVPMAICSGASLADIKTVLDTAKSQLGENIIGWFDTIVAADDVEHGKPHPEGYLLALKRLNQKLATSFSSKNCIVVEDSHWGLESAQAAQMNTIAVTNSYSRAELDGKADLILESLREIKLATLENLISN